jgi:type II secretory pathway component PulM
MMDWFNSREPRERILLVILAVLLGIFSIWFVATRDGGPNGKTRLEAAQMDRELWLRAAPRLTAGTTMGDRSEFSRGALVDASRKRGVALSRVQPQAAGGLSVWIDDAPTSALYGLINDLVSSHAVKVETAVMTTAPNGGVNAQLTLTPL